MNRASLNHRALNQTAALIMSFSSNLTQSIRSPSALAGPPMHPNSRSVTDIDPKSPFQKRACNTIILQLIPIHRGPCVSTWGHRCTCSYPPHGKMVFTLCAQQRRVQWRRFSEIQASNPCFVILNTLALLRCRKHQRDNNTRLHTLTHQSCV